MTVDAIKRDRLFELFGERAEFDRRGYSQGYFHGRIDEFCAQNAITEQECADLHREWLEGRAP